ncbi:exonuclease SbcD [Bacillus paralicheniformis]|uniref:metallophosphoesterase family protein n=1 Tax=Bacillus paralicheniformis TaxID=1648923 RepID=UPI0013EF52B7|nr:metallophosphoesterase [Bacillus paralicheniformis]QII49520.1 exonuclease SbcD [Bacillus paralicheniformis]
MTKLLYTGDWHLRGTTPRNRKDNYKDSIKEKLLEIFNLARYRQVEAIITAGDTFHTPEVATGVLLEFADLIAEHCPVPLYTTAGNHDIYGYNLDTYNRTSLRVLEKIVPQFEVINDPAIPKVISGPGGAVQITFTPYSADIDRNGYGYCPGVENDDVLKIHVAHGMLLDHVPPFDRFTLIKDVKTTADLILTGHDHTGYGIYERADGKTFVNCGAICRLSASQSEITRKVEVLLIDIKDSKFDLELIPLQSAKPGEEILDRSAIEQEQERQYAMEEFASLIQSTTGEKVMVDINSIVESIAEHEGFQPSVVRIALEKIAESQESLKA